MNLPDPPALPTRVSVPDTVLWQPIDEQVVLLDVSAGQYHALNDVGSRMWTQLVDAPDVADAFARLTHVFDVQDAVLRRDLAGFIAELVRTGLLATP